MKGFGRNLDSHDPILFAATRSPVIFARDIRESIGRAFRSSSPSPPLFSSRAGVLEHFDSRIPAKGGPMASKGNGADLLSSS